MQNEKQNVKYSHDLYKHNLVLVHSGNKQHGLWLNEYNRQWAGKQEYMKCEYRMQQKLLTLFPTHLQVLSQKHELLEREHVQQYIGI